MSPVASSRNPSAVLISRSIDAKRRSGNIDLELPESARFELKATTDRGEVHNEFGSPIQTETKGQGATLRGKVGQAPGEEELSVGAAPADAAASCADEA